MIGSQNPIPFFSLKGPGPTAPRRQYPPPPDKAMLSGVTRDASGVALPFCTVKVFRAADDSKAGETVSDANGNWSFGVDPLWAYYCVQYKPSISLAVLGATAGVFAAQLTPKIPNFAQDGDILVCAIAIAGNDVFTFPAGWTKEVETGHSVSLTMAIGWRRMVAGDANPLITWVNNAQAVAKIAAFRGAVASGDPFDASVVSNNTFFGSDNPDQGGVIVPSITPTAPGSLILLAGAAEWSPTPGVVRGYSGTSPDLVEIFSVFVPDNSTVVGLAFGLKDSASPPTPTGDRIISFGGPGDSLNFMTGAMLSMKAASVDLFGSSSNKLVGA